MTFTTWCFNQQGYKTRGPQKGSFEKWIPKRKAKPKPRRIISLAEIRAMTAEQMREAIGG